MLVVHPEYPYCHTELSALESVATILPSAEHIIVSVDDRHRLPGTSPLGLESVFELGSITRTFTGTLLTLAVRRLEEPVELAEPVAAAVDVDDVHVVEQAVEYGGGEDLIAGKDLGPVAHVLLGGEYGRFRGRRPTHAGLGGARKLAPLVERKRGEEQKLARVS